MRAASIGLAALALCSAAAAAESPVRLHPDNAHYFLFRGKPTVLITSGEHYGAVLNREFDYLPYLDEMKAHGFNLTRTFSGTYREGPTAFGIVDNTLAPADDRFACPWTRLEGGRFDLSKYDDAYFTRLKEFIAQAGKRDVVVEFVLFCAVYDDKLWALNPMNPENNVNGVGKIGRLEPFALADEKLTALQEAFVRKVAAELKDCDNLYYEICNEPYFGGVTPEWTDRMVATLADAEKGMPAHHLIAQNVANGSAKVEKPNANVAILNFHYAAPPDAVAVNFGLDRVVAFDETGFRGKDDLPYRTEAWDFLVAGGAVYSNLDYSFTCAKPEGTFTVTTSPGGGGPELRKQLSVLKAFMDGFEFVRMKPDNSVVKEGSVTARLLGDAGAAKEAKATVRCLAETGKQYAIYVKGGVRAELTLDLPRGAYKAEWVNTKTGAAAKTEEFDHDGGGRALISPDYTEDVALRVKRQ
jgi:hypothetical protein